MITNRPLADGYRAEVDTVDAAEWYRQTSTFADANIYQTWQDGVGPERFADVSRLLVLRGGDVVGGAEVRLFTLPFIGRGIAYIRWGPLWRRGAGRPDTDVFRQTVRAVRNELVGRRDLVLRLLPRLFVEDDLPLVGILEEEGFAQVAHAPLERTLVMDLAPGMDELRQGMLKKWRNALSKAERAGLTVVTGTGAELFDEFAILYAQLLQRKRFEPTADIDKHRRIQACLPEPMKMGAVIARHQGDACAGAIYSAMGDTALYLFGATNEMGMKTCASYLVQWELLRHLKERGLKRYDLHGINPESNPGTYTFKKGLAGKTGRELTFLGQTQSFKASLGARTVLFADRLRNRVRGRQAPPSKGVAPGPALDA